MFRAMHFPDTQTAITNTERIRTGTNLLSRTDGASVLFTQRDFTRVAGP